MGESRRRYQPQGLDGRLPAFDGDFAQWLDLDRVADQPMRFAGDQDLARLGSLLEPGGNVHRVAGDQPLTARRVPGYDLTGRDPGPPGHGGRSGWSGGIG
jgi:hypothetical protein